LGKGPRKGAIILWKDKKGRMATTMAMAPGRNGKTWNSSNKSGRAVDQDIKDKYKKGNKQKGKNKAAENY
jgi:hypothetical protein